ncbi:MAG: NAD(P)H-dependent oxidoreductase [Caulobacteraceae bacterium]|nr:NAD(P)H-dependent oxidoreductase [Caulobacteraceae bacterium]
MAQALTVAVLVGSLRKASFTRKVAEALTKLSPEGFSYKHVGIGQLPLYNQDLDDEGSPPEAWTAFRETIRACDAVLFVTPEYNRSVPGGLKNALDVGSRPYGKSAWNRKPCAIVSVTPGAMGGFGANHHLRQSLVFLDMPMLNQPEAYIGHASDLVDDEFNVKNEGTRAFLKGFMEAFGRWTTTLVRARDAAA